jgi:DNA repair protein RecN (Recombination protein N)
MLVERGEALVDLYGQHAHQSLLRPGVQRQSLDLFGNVDLVPVRQLRAAIAEVDRRLDHLGGDPSARQRELDLLRYELEEIDRAAIVDEDEDRALDGEQHLLEAAVALRAASTRAYETLEGENAPGILDLVGSVVEELSHDQELEPFLLRLKGLAAELDDVATDLRRAAEGFEENPERLEAVGERRALLARLSKKHGGTLRDVLKASTMARARIDELESSDAVRETLMSERELLLTSLADAEGVVGDARREAASRLGEAIGHHLGELGLGGARLEVVVPSDGIGDNVEFLLAANRGEAALPLAKVASGGELARAMLALRLVLSSAPPTLIFDEVDAGIGGEAALAVGRALATLGRTHQVLVVTHLAQVAAFADHHLVVEKYEVDGRTLSQVREVDGQDRVIELSRMLSGHPDSAVARQHAAELLLGAGASQQA